MSTILIENGREIGGSAEPKPDLVSKSDLTSIFETGTTASQAISAGTYFYLNDVLVRAKISIAINDTFTENTNYEVVTAGALNEIVIDKTSVPSVEFRRRGNVVTIFMYGYMTTSNAPQFVVPQGFRPPTNTVTMGYNITDKTTILFDLAPNGSLHIKTLTNTIIAASKGIYAIITYLI